MRVMGRRDWCMLLLQALCGIFLFRMFLLQGLLYTSVGEAGIMTGATPAVTLIMAGAFLKEPFNTTSFTGISSTVAGILLVQGIILPGNVLRLEHLFGNLLVLCAVISESLFKILSRIYSLRTPSLNPIVQTALVSGIALLLCLVPALLENPALSLLSLGLKEWLALVWYGFMVTALGFIFLYAGIHRCTATTAAAFSGMMPFSALILSVIILGEEVGWPQWAGGFLVVLGMIIIGRGTGHRITRKSEICAWRDVNARYPE